jgi:hypothetical protein
MVLLYPLLFIVAIILCIVLVYGLFLLGAALLLYPVAKLGDVLLRLLRTKSDATQQAFLLSSLGGWLGLWCLLYLATISKWLTVDQRDAADVLLALVTSCYLIPLLLLLVLLKRNWYSILLACLSLFFSSKPPSRN